MPKNLFGNPFAPIPKQDGKNKWQKKTNNNNFNHSHNVLHVLAHDYQFANISRYVREEIKKNNTEDSDSENYSNNIPLFHSPISFRGQKYMFSGKLHKNNKGGF